MKIGAPVTVVLCPNRRRLKRYIRRVRITGFSKSHDSFFVNTYVGVNYFTIKFPLHEEGVSWIRGWKRSAEVDALQAAASL